MAGVRLLFLRGLGALTLSVLVAGVSMAQSGAMAGAPVNARSNSDDPRIGLKAGMYDAGEAAMGMEKLASLPKPMAFTPPPPSPDEKDPLAALHALLKFGNSDMAFQGGHLFLGNFYGINFYDISSPENIKLMTSLVCPGGQGDVSVYGHLLFMSVESASGRLDCGAQGVPVPAGYKPPPFSLEEALSGKLPPQPPANPDRFRGVRIFDISDLSNPKQVAAVQSCRGSHTHTLVVDPKDKENVYLYISGTSFVRPSEELASCLGEATDKDPNTSLFRIDVVKVPLAHPEQAKIVSSPRVLADPKTGMINGLWNGGNHGEGTQTSWQTRECHDITVYSAIGLAAGACAGNGILLNIKDPVNPVRVEVMSDPNYAYWHSATFNNDGTKLLYTDEWGAGIQPRCRQTDPMNWGADAIFDLKNDKLRLAGYYKMPAPQTEQENCVAHNGSLIPVPGRDIEVQAWYQGGVSMVDFTDPTHPVEIGYFDRGPINAMMAVEGGYWSAYWYNGYIYGSEIARGIDVFRLVPSKYLTQNEIDAAKTVQVDLENVQNQQKIVWPQNYVVARAYVDQLARSNALDAQRISYLNAAIDKADKSHSKKDEVKLRKMAAGLDKEAEAKSPADAKRMHALAEILKHSA
jgi:hypothetical protein